MDTSLETLKLANIITHHKITFKYFYCVHILTDADNNMIFQDHFKYGWTEKKSCEKIDLDTSGLVSI
jgi:hypothetical protein